MARRWLAGIIGGMSEHDPVAAVRESFAKQQLMSTLGAVLRSVSPGAVEIELPFSERILQQHGFAHAGAIVAIADSACGYAALSVMPAGSAVLSVEFKVNLLAPAAGERFIARGRVVRSGRTLTVCQADVVAVTGPEEKSVALLQGTMMRVDPPRGRAG